MHYFSIKILFFCVISTALSSYTSETNEQYHQKSNKKKHYNNRYSHQRTQQCPSSYFKNKFRISCIANDPAWEQLQRTAISCADFVLRDES